MQLPCIFTIRWSWACAAKARAFAAWRIGNTLSAKETCRSFSVSESFVPQRGRQAEQVVLGESRSAGRARDMGRAGAGALEQMLREKMGLYGILDRKKYPFLCELVRHRRAAGRENAAFGESLCIDRGACKNTFRFTEALAFAGTAFQPSAARDRADAKPFGGGFVTGVPAMAEACGLSCAQFRRDFLAAMGCSPQQYTLNCRMQKAQRLLLLTDRKITDIALAVGYQDASGFNRCFREHFGVSPRQLRQRGKE